MIAETIDPTKVTFRPSIVQGIALRTFSAKTSLVTIKKSRIRTPYEQEEYMYFFSALESEAGAAFFFSVKLAIESDIVYMIG